LFTDLGDLRHARRPHASRSRPPVAICGVYEVWGQDVGPDASEVVTAPITPTGPLGAAADLVAARSAPHPRATMSIQGRRPGKDLEGARTPPRHTSGQRRAARDSTGASLARNAGHTPQLGHLAMDPEEPLQNSPRGPELPRPARAADVASDKGDLTGSNGDPTGLPQRHVGAGIAREHKIGSPSRRTTIRSRALRQLGPAHPEDSQG
jgi:hypothetical protein